MSLDGCDDVVVFFETDAVDERIHLRWGREIRKSEIGDRFLFSLKEERGNERKKRTGRGEEIYRSKDKASYFRALRAWMPYARS